MRILVVSNFYPPFFIGGYEVACRDVVEQLRSRGHDVTVLTSTYGLGHSLSESGILRVLRISVDPVRHSAARFIRAARREYHHRRLTARTLKKRHFDLVYVWNLAGLSLNVVLLAQSCGIPVCYYVFDGWLSQWDHNPWYRFWLDGSQPFLSRAPRRLAYPVAKGLGIVPQGSLNLRNVQFASAYLKEKAVQAGKPVTDAEVLPWGIDTRVFGFKEKAARPSRLLFVGRFCPEKGLPTLIEAMRLLVWEHRVHRLKLTILGGNHLDPDYGQAMRRLVGASGLESSVEFMDFLPREQLPGVYREHDILIFPSTWDEPFGITILEAMSSGLAVVGTATGGSAEIMISEVNSLVFPRDNPACCARQIVRLLNDPELYEKLRRAGRRTVEERFQLEQAVERIEKSLFVIVERSRPRHVASSVTNVVL